MKNRNEPRIFFAAMPISAWALPPKPRVLLVQAGAQARLEMTRRLRQAGAEVIAARDHSEGWHYLQKYQFDVLLADVSSPQQCADELVQRCLSMPKAHRPQHVIPLGLGVDNSPFKSAAMGFSIKPANLSTLLDTFRGPLN